MYGGAAVRRAHYGKVRIIPVLEMKAFNDIFYSDTEKSSFIFGFFMHDFLDICFIHTVTVIGDINEKETALTAYPDTEQTILHSVGEAMDNGIFHDRLKEQLEDQTAAGFLVDLKVRLDITQKIIFL